MRPYEPYFLEDLEVGECFETARRTITETDLVQFAMISSDWNAVHTDALASGVSEFGGRIVHGALGLTLATGLLQRTGMFEGSAVALLGFREWTFTRPLFVGDTVLTRMHVLDVRETRTGDRGVVARRLQLVNQHDQVVQEGISDFMVWKRAAAPSTHDPSHVRS